MDKKVSKASVDVESKIVNLFTSDYIKKIHVREISRLIFLSHRSVSMALKSLEKKGIMKHETAGRSKLYFLNLENPLAKDYIKNAESANKIKLVEKNFIIKKFLSELEGSLSDIPLILFGSYAKGAQTKESDMDILVIKNGNERELAKKITEFSKLYKIEIQIQKSTKENFELGLKERDNLIIEILKNHIILNNTDFFVDIFWRNFNDKR